jgi:thiamine transporter
MELNPNPKPLNPIFKIKLMAETGVLVGLAVGLYFLSPLRLPNAGKLSLDMLPIYFCSYRRGFLMGMIAGGITGMLILLIDPYFVHPLQLLLDYPLPYMLVGLSGWLKNYVVLGIILGGLGRFLCHFVSGIVFFSAYAPAGAPAWLYSLLYNASYVLPQIIIAILFLPFILKRLKT